MCGEGGCGRRLNWIEPRRPAPHGRWGRDVGERGREAWGVGWVVQMLEIPPAFQYLGVQLEELRRRPLSSLEARSSLETRSMEFERWPKPCGFGGGKGVLTGLGHRA